MKEFKAGEKVTQKFTREGAVEKNHATGEEKNISGREAEADLNRRRRASSRLAFTDAERETPELKRAIKRSDKAADRLDEARENIPTTKKLIRKRMYDEAAGKGRTRLVFEEVEKKPDGKLRHNPLSRPVKEIGGEAHRKVREVENENVGVEAGHAGKRLIEKGIGKTGRGLSSAYRSHRLKPWRELDKAEEKAARANANYYYQKTKLSRKYAKEARDAGQGAKKTAAAAKAAAAKAREAAEKTTSFIASHWKGLLIGLVIGLLVMLIAGGISSCSNMAAGTMNAILGTTYTAEDEDINGAETDYGELEGALQREIDGVESSHHGYDEYRYDLDEIGHDPYELASYLTVLYEDYTRAEVQAALREIFGRQYTLTYTESVEVRHRTEERTGTDPLTGETYTYEVDVAYDYYILTITLRNKPIGTIAEETLDDQQLERYLIYMETRGGHDGLFADNPSLNGGINAGEYDGYSIPAEALTDEDFRKLITEAEKYLGYPYVWGGSSPETSFDCSGFVCYVLNHSGVYSIGRTTANGIKSRCTIISAGEAKPGDIIFFQGTYSTPGASHVGIYVGNGMMIHCGNPIQYANTNSPYWQEHFYCFGRLDYNN
ncbi:MAG: hypothetical protein HDR08_10950 [Lachnospiraceae bacterium]|nr:hypothetical protein [Lachnospiraceae bacterium]